MKKIIEKLGGISNIKMVTSTATSLVVVLDNKENIKVDQLLESHCYKVRERYFGYYLDYGPGSKSLCLQIRKEMKNYKDCEKYSVR